MSFIDRIERGLIVACQAPESSPMANPDVMAAVARSAELGGASAIRADGADVITAIRASVNIPVIGSKKLYTPESNVFITPTFECARQVIVAGADIVAVDFTPRKRPENETLADLVKHIKTSLKASILADISSLEEGIIAEELGADAVATTLAPGADEPDFDLISALSRSIEIPVICEGRVRTPKHAAEAMQAGAYAVVVGTAISSPEWLTRRFSSALKILDSSASSGTIKRH